MFPKWEKPGDIFPSWPFVALNVLFKNGFQPGLTLGMYSGGGNGTVDKLCGEGVYGDGGRIAVGRMDSQSS